MDRRAWQATVHGFARSQTRLSGFYFASLVAQTVKNPPAMQEAWVRSLGWEDLLEIGHGNSLQYSGLENPRGQESLVGYSPWGCKESDTPE